MNETEFSNLVRTSRGPEVCTHIGSAMKAPTEPRKLIDHTCQRCNKSQRFVNHPGATCWGCQEREEAMRRKRDKWLAASGVSLRHKRLGQWESLTGPTAYTSVVGKVRTFTETRNAILALIGKRGTGKTQVASVAILATIANGKPAKIVTAIDLLADLKHRYSNPEDGGEREWLRQWESYHLLVIDEIGELVSGEHSRSMLTTMIDRRYSEMKPTILIGNVTTKDFAIAVGSSIADRCNEGGGVIVCDGWQSFRQ